MNHTPVRLTTEQRVDAACQSIDLGNNGYADIGDCQAVADGVRARGYVVIRTLDIVGTRYVFRGFTPRAQEALALEPFGQSTYKPVPVRIAYPDYEAAILARQARHFD